MNYSFSHYAIPFTHQFIMIDFIIHKYADNIDRKNKPFKYLLICLKTLLDENTDLFSDKITFS